MGCRTGRSSASTVSAIERCVTRWPRLAGRAQGIRAAPVEAGTVQADHRCDPAGGSGRTSQATPHLDRALPTSYRRTRHGRGVVSGGGTLCPTTSSEDPGRDRARAVEGVHPANSPFLVRKPRSTSVMSQSGCVVSWSSAICSVPNVILRQSDPSRISVGWSGSVLRRPPARTTQPRRRPDREGPLRQPPARNRGPSSGVHSGTGRVRALDGVPVIPGPGAVLLPTRSRRRSREGRSRRPNRLGPTKPPRPGSGGRLDCRAEHVDRRLGRR